VGENPGLTPGFGVLRFGLRGDSEFRRPEMWALVYCPPFLAQKPPDID
jgi:hypothetical protein